MGGGSSHTGGGGGNGAGAGSSTTGGNGGGISAAAACAEYASKICAQNEACAPDVLTFTYGDVATCKTRYALFCSELLDHTTAPNDSWTAQQFADCGDALSTLQCYDYLIAPFTGGPAACHPKPGKIQTGQPCIDAGQCKSAYCKHIAGTSCGTCTDLAALGAPCDTPFDCESGACAGMSGSKTCVMAKKENDPCAGDGDCGFGLACQGSAALLCKKALNEGQPCGGNSLCDPLQGLYCNTAINQCARGGYADAGGQCGALPPPDGGTAGLVGCKASARCTNSMGAFYCVAAAADGQPCDLSMGIGCMTPAVCTNMVCTLPLQSNCP
jgi:hypothetical protein